MLIKSVLVLMDSILESYFKFKYKKFILWPTVHARIFYGHLAFHIHVIWQVAWVQKRWFKALESGNVWRCVKGWPCSCGLLTVHPISSLPPSRTPPNSQLPTPNSQPAAPTPTTLSWQWAVTALEGAGLGWPILRPSCGRTTKPSDLRPPEVCTSVASVACRN